ncbi:hypothetical protein TorRG33x02_300070 [Trema orientale]|uniref:Transmembrane protein n=1 Tax=Trema orientale TaxID=63057 RepID=A0A2P5C2G1_TREOI|nr:hypothetical protein TorRG33x02_300070 [Trema orientale]
MEVKQELPNHPADFSLAGSENESQSTNRSSWCTHLESCGSIIAQDFEQEAQLWRFTCYGHWKHAPCDIVGDISYEELRAAAYDYKRSGLSLSSIVAREQNLLNSKMTDFLNLKTSHVVPPNPSPTPANQETLPGFLANRSNIPGTVPNVFSQTSQGSTSTSIGSFSSENTFPEIGPSAFSQAAQVTSDTPVITISEPDTILPNRPPPPVPPPPNIASRQRIQVSRRTSSASRPNDLSSETQAWSLPTRPKNIAARARTFVHTITGIFNKDDPDIPISIFKVPSSLTQGSTEAYVPKLVGLGAIHHLKPELEQMQMYKVTEAKRIHKGFQGLDFYRLIEFLEEVVAPSVRASYNMYLDITDDVLACIMAIDGLFLFDLLCCYGIKKEALSNSSLLSQMVDSAGRRLAQETTLKEAMMLENQIPILVLKSILAIESSEFEIVSKLFPEILVGFCQFVSPFNIIDDYPPYKTLKHAHLLDLIFHLIMLKGSPEKNPEEERDELRLLGELFEKANSKVQVPEPFERAISETREKILDHVINIAKDMAPLPLKKPIELVQGLRSLPWSELGSSVSSAVTTEPSEEETLIPRASELHKAGVIFIPDHITNIKFDRNRVSFRLPSIKLNGNSEVVIRNLVAYEAMIKSETEPLILTRYVELMSGLIRTSEDVKVLKDHGIIKMESISGERVAKVFNGMSKSVKSTNTKNIDKEIEGITRYYNSLWKVSARKFINKGRWIAGSWCKVFAAVLLLLLMGFQAFCSVYECRRLSFKSYGSQGQQSLRVLSLRSYV